MQNTQKPPIICAIDTTDVEQAKRLSQQLGGSVGALKLGLEFFTANGAAGVAQIASQAFPVFLDLKFHDIPNTVSKAIKATAGSDTFLMTVHTQGGKAMMRASADAAAEVAITTGKKRPMVVGVTILTSMDQNDLGSIGVASSVSDQVVRLAELAQASGLDGIVCSPHEIDLIRKACGVDFKLVVPGIRPAGSDAGDQKRVLTPKEAVDKGADYLVIGRPITEAADPKAAAQAIWESIQ
jgi:orotidine-5'-phosphate decarboxylase